MQDTPAAKTAWNCFRVFFRLDLAFVCGRSEQKRRMDVLMLTKLARLESCLASGDLLE